MTLTALSIANFKTFASSQRMPLRPPTFVYGANNAGKSSTLHAFAHHAVETGGSYTVKRYRSRKSVDAEGWRHVEIRLEPENPEFAPIVLRESDEGDVRVVAELVEVL